MYGVSNSTITSFRDQKVTAPLKHVVNWDTASYLWSFRDQKVTAPLKHAATESSALLRVKFP